MILDFLLVAGICFVAVYLAKLVWPHVPLLPGLFEDMAHGYSYDKEGNRIEDK